MNALDEGERFSRVRAEDSKLRSTAALALFSETCYNRSGVYLFGCLVAKKKINMQRKNILSDNFQMWL